MALVTLRISAFLKIHLCVVTEGKVGHWQPHKCLCTFENQGGREMCSFRVPSGDPPSLRNSKASPPCTHFTEAVKQVGTGQVPAVHPSVTVS